MNIHVRVMLMMSVSLAMSAEKGANGAASWTMRSAAASSMRWPEERLMSTRSIEPSALIDTVTTRLP
ncbi:hypothetical protein D3C83_231260 [compost metagenome]